MRGLSIRRPCAGGLYWVAFVLLAAGALTGFGFLVSLSVDGRTANVTAFNSAVAGWPAVASSFRGLVVNITGDGGLLALPASTSADSYPDTEGLDVPITDNIHYTAQSPGNAPIQGRSFNSEEKTSVTISVNGTRTTIDNIPLFKVERSDKKTTYKRVSSLCFTVNAQRVVDGGCAKDDGWTSPAWEDCNANCFSSFKIVIDVRSGDDPFVKAMRVTSGSLFFGVSQRNKAVIGGVLFAVCSFLFFAMCGSLMGPPAPPWNNVDISQTLPQPYPEYGVPQYGVTNETAYNPTGGPGYAGGYAGTQQYYPSVAHQPQQQLFYSADKNPHFPGYQTQAVLGTVPSASAPV